MKKKISKILAVILSFLTIFSCVPAEALTAGNSYTFEKTYLNAYYETGQWRTANGDYHDNYGQVAQYNLKSNGEPIYCIQIYNGVDASAATAKSIKDTDIWKYELTDTAKSIITLVSIWGYPNYNYGYSKTNAQLATQVLIWEAETGARTNYSTGCSSWAKSIFTNYSDALSCYNEILKACQKHSAYPSFRNTTVTLKGTGETNAVTLKDSNGVLNQFERTSTDKHITLNSSGNNLKIWATGVTSYSGSVTLSKKKTYTDTAFALTGAGQTLFYGTIADPVTTRININVEAEKTCNVTVKKQSSLTGATLDGAEFKVQQYNVSTKTWSNYKTLTATTSNGSRVYTATNLLVSDDNGGWFKIVETKSPTGYDNNPTYSSSNSNTYSDGRFRFMYSDDDSGKTFTLTAKDNPSEGSVAIKKTSEDGKIEGVKIHLYGTSDIGVKVDQTGVTNAKGELKFNNLYIGTYTVEEIEVDGRYVKPEKQTVKVTKDDIATVYFDNHLKHFNISVEKKSSLTDEILDGAAFKVQKWSASANAFVDYKTLTATGSASTRKYVANDLVITEDNGGKFKLVETGVPTGYSKAATFSSSNNDITSDGIFTFDTNSDENNMMFYFTVKNKPSEGDLSVKKASEDGKIEGFKFHLYGTSTIGIKVDEYGTSNGQGKVNFKNIYVGTYTIEEVDIPSYYITPEKQTVTISENKVSSVSFENNLKRGNLKVIKTSEDNLVEGVRFHLFGTSDSGTRVNEYATTNAQGVAIFEDILIGTGYVIEEMDVPEKYIVPDSQTAAVEWNKTNEVKFHNKLKRGDLKVIKTSEDDFVEGIKFHLYGNSIADIYVDEYATTNADGVAMFKNILIGRNYVIEEVDTPIRYVVPNLKTATIEWNKITTVHFENILKKFRVQVTKSDSEKGLPQGDATLAGAVYGIYKNGKLIDAYTTDINGQFTTKYYVCGDDWTIKEISPSEGYLLDDSVHKIGSEPKLYTVELNTISSDVEEDVKRGSIAIIKHTDDGSTQIETPEEGAEFEVYLKSAGSYAKAKTTERDVIVCDEFGFAQTKDLPYGVYTVHQTKGWDGREKIADFDVFISKDGYVYRYIINDSNFESYIKIVKTDAETGKAILYAGAAFQIYAPDGTLIEQTFTYPTPTTIDTFYTNSEGYLVTPEKLPFGSGYKLVEVQAPYGYILDSTPILFDVKQEDSTKENELTIITINRPNVPQKGVIEITKTGEVFTSVTESNDIYSPIYSDQALANAVFEIYAYEDIITPEGTVRYKKGQLVDTVTTGKNGTAESKQLYLGKYIVKEKTAPNTFVLNSNEFIVELTYAGQNMKVTSTDLSVYNERQKVCVSLSKILENDIAYKIGMNGEIISVQFGIFAAENIKSADGSVIPKDGLVTIANCDKNGNIAFDCDLPIGFKWYAKEINVDNHYFISDTKYEFETEYRGSDTSVYEIKINNDEAIENTLKRGTVKGIKVGEKQEALAGALIGIFAPGTIEFTEGNAIATVISTEDGSFAFENVPYGEWIVKEIAPPESYILDATQHHVYITDDGVTINIRIDNRHIYGNAKIKKVDSDTGEAIPGVGFHIYDKDMNLVTEGYTDKNGRYYVENLVYGDYFYQEFYCDESYVLDDTLYPFSIREDGVTVKAEMTNRKKEGNFEITKTDISTGEVLTNVGFRIYDEGGNVIAEGYTDENGVATFESLIYGDYFYQEFSCDESYVLDDTLYPFSITEDGVTVKAEMTNRKKEGNFEITKTDISTGEVLTNVGFRIYDEGGNAIAEGYTDENGVATFENFIYGDYFYQEFSCDESYVLDDTLYPFSITEDGVTVKAEMTNRKKEGNFEITKTDISTGEVLTNVGFRIYDEDGNIIAEGYTDENGVATFESLIYGDYFYQEFSCDESYVLDDTLYPFSIREDSVTVKAEMTNSKKEGNFEITKIDVSSGEVLPNVGFRIYDEDGNIIAEGYTDKNGVATFEGLIYGNYFYQEFSCDESYVLDDTLYPFSITEDGVTVKAEITNRKKAGKLIITKVDGKDKKTVLVGVVFIIEDENGNIVAELTTNENGIAEIGLPYGKYVLYEKSTIDGYVLDNQKHDIEITEDGQILEITIENDKIIVDTPKVDTPYTGDNRNYGVVIGLCMIAIGAAVSAAILKIKSKKYEDEE